MKAIRKAADRGHFDHGWLDTYHTFSFGDYYDPAHMGFRSLRVINEDRIEPGQGFGMHPHRDMEIITCVLSGQLEHRDSLGSGSVIGPGKLQRMSAGTGIMHSEFNPSRDEPVHLYQIWLLPDRKGYNPSYEEKDYPEASRRNAWQFVASPSGKGGALTIHQDCEILLATLAPKSDQEYDFAHERHGWLQVLRGTVRANGDELSAGDALALSDEPRLKLQTGAENAEVMLFDLA